MAEIIVLAPYPEDVTLNFCHSLQKYHSTTNFPKYFPHPFLENVCLQGRITALRRKIFSRTLILPQSHTPIPLNTLQTALQRALSRTAPPENTSPQETNAYLTALRQVPMLVPL